MVAPKGVVSNEMWKKVSRSVDKIDKIYKNTAGKLNLLDEDRYRNTDIYDEVVSWRAVLRSSEMLILSEDHENVKNIYGETLSDDLDDFTFKLEDKMHSYWDQVKVSGL